MVEDGVAFCLQCGAPQIRVRGLRPQSENPPPAGDMGGEVAGPVPGGGDELSVSSLEPRRLAPPAGIRWADAWRSAILAGFFLTVAMAVPNVMPLVWFFVATVAAGGIAAALYARRSRLPLTLARGARLGMLGGLAGWVAWVTISLLMLALGGAQLIASLKEALQKVVATSDPRAQEILTTPGVMAVFVVLSMLMLLVIVLFCSAIGGLIAAKLFGKGPRE